METARCRGEAPHALAAATTANACRFFGITLADAGVANGQPPELV
jgi:hypothetical protein